MLDHLYLLARTTTDSVRLGFLPAAERLGLRVVVLTDHPAEHLAATLPRDVEVVPCAVTDFHAVVSAVSTGPRPAAVFSNSDHLQTQAALAAAYFGLPGNSAVRRRRSLPHPRRRRRGAACGPHSGRALPALPTGSGGLPDVPARRGRGARGPAGGTRSVDRRCQAAGAPPQGETRLRKALAGSPA